MGTRPSFLMHAMPPTFIHPAPTLHLQVLLHAPRTVYEYQRFLDPTAGGDQIVCVEARVARIGALSTHPKGVYFKVTLEVRRGAPGLGMLVGTAQHRTWAV